MREALALRHAVLLGIRVHFGYLLHMRDLFPRLSAPTRRRVALAAASEGMHATAYCKRLVDQWLTRLPLTLPPVAAEGPVATRVAISDSAHRTLRLFAAEHEVSLGALVTRIVTAYAPMAVDTLVRVMQDGE